jgi:L-ascorbate 6-phosphate lactonase
VVGTTLYHAGDTIVTRELIDALDDRCIDVALLPSNGRDYFREEQDITGNMNANEAIALARRIGARLVIPYHWDGFAGNTSSPGALSNEANGEGPHVLVLQRFAPFRLSVKQK